MWHNAPAESQHRLSPSHRAQRLVQSTAGSGNSCAHAPCEWSAPRRRRHLYSQNILLTFRGRQTFRAVIATDGLFESVTLPNADTGSIGDEGLLCFRAVSSALLTIYDLATTQKVMRSIIFNLLDPSESEHFAIDNAFEFTLNEFLSAVGSEEQSSTLREDLWERVDEHMQKAFALKNYADDQPTTVKEIPAIIGLVRWTLTHPSMRTPRTYRTESVSCWQLSIILSSLGFQVSVSPVILNTIEHDPLATSEQVFYVTAADTETDALAPPDNSDHRVWRCHFSPRLVPIYCVPEVLFQFFRFDEELDFVDRLTEIWVASIKRGVSTLGSPCLQPEPYQGRVYIPLLLEDKEGKDIHSPLFRLLEPLLKEFVPGHEWTDNYLDEVIRNLYRRDGCLPEPSMETLDFDVLAEPSAGHMLREWYYIFVLLLGTLYAVSFKSLEIVSAVKVAIYPGQVQKMHFWMDDHWLNNLQAVLTKTGCRYLSARRWNQMCYEILQGSEEGQTSENWRFGGYQHGIFMCSAFLVSPSMCSDAFFRFRLQYGQPVDIPHDAKGVVYAISTFYSTFDNYKVKKRDALKGLTGNSREQFRVEPNWRDDPRLFLVECLEDGKAKHTFAPGGMIELVESDKYLKEEKI